MRKVEDQDNGMCKWVRNPLDKESRMSEMRRMWIRRIIQDRQDEDMCPDIILKRQDMSNPPQPPKGVIRSLIWKKP